MRHCCLALIAAMLALPASARAVDPVKPKEPGLRTQPRNGVETPKDPGLVVPPPRVRDEAVKTPPKNIDPKIDDATKKIDEANRAKADRIETDERKPQK